MQYRKARDTNATDTSFATKTPTLTKPSGDGVHFFEGFGSSTVFIAPYGSGDADDRFELKVISWRSVLVGGLKVWVPAETSLEPYLCTLSTSAGVAGGSVSDSEKFCDVIAARNKGDMVAFSPGDNRLAYVIIPVYYPEAIEFLFSTFSGSPTGMNALWIPL